MRRIDQFSGQEYSQPASSLQSCGPFLGKFIFARLFMLAFQRCIFRLGRLCSNGVVPLILSVDLRKGSKTDLRIMTGVELRNKGGVS